eukprot:TRINITY_DN821_c0_g2_i7.p1 TRINITY_DN821_c0_g2~~TRINITY_DN821_c0_g2_i7.p1  ORF type:complete len:223 (+),score=71.03 TRINITY_DN821_c0_g2_i7:162-830(+)
MCIRDRYQRRVHGEFSFVYKMAEKPQGVGSVWNVNSWHWENKNYTKIAEQMIENKVKAYQFQSEGITFVLEEVKKFKGEAQINIRKGKQIITYEIGFEVTWKADTDDDEAQGKFAIKDVNESDLDYEIYDIVVDDKTGISDKCKAILKKTLKGHFDGLLSTLTEELSQFESDPQKIERDRLLREEALQKTVQARAEKGAEKERLLEEQKAKELEMKRQLNQK